MRNYVKLAMRRLSEGQTSAARSLLRDGRKRHGLFPIGQGLLLLTFLGRPAARFIGRRLPDHPMRAQSQATEQ